MKMKLATLLYCITSIIAVVQALPPELVAEVCRHHHCVKAKHPHQIDPELAIESPSGNNPTTRPVHTFCFSPGQPCSKVKRVADAAAEALALAEPVPVAARDVWCYSPGQACAKARRDALALVEAVAEAQANTEYQTGSALSCFRPGASCSKAKREALDAAENQVKARSLEKIVERSGNVSSVEDSQVDSANQTQQTMHWRKGQEKSGVIDLVKGVAKSGVWQKNSQRY